jgi:dodecin
MRVAKILELVGSSDKAREDAAQVAITEAAKTIHGIRGLEVTVMTARVDSKTAKIQEHRVCVKLSLAWKDKKSHGMSGPNAFTYVDNQSTITNE